MPAAVENTSDLPLVSVIMPVRNEERFLERSLGAVLAQDYPADRIEVLIVDGHSIDGTRAVVRRFQEAHRNLRLIENAHRIVPAGMNAAMAVARGEVLVRVDGHCEIDRSYVRRCIGHLQKSDVAGVGGPIVTVGETRVAQAIAAAMSCSFGVGGAAFRTATSGTRLVDTIPFAAYRREAVSRGGAYDEELVRNQDDEYNYRLRKLGGKLLLAADVRSRYYSRNTLAALAGQYFQYGFWKVRVLQKHPWQMRPRQIAPGALVLALAGLAALALVGVAGRVALALVAGSYGVANLMVSVRVARRKGWWMIGLLPAIFPTLHVSYGVGFLVGLVRFSTRWLDRPSSSVVSPPDCGTWNHAGHAKTGR